MAEESKEVMSPFEASVLSSIRRSYWSEVTTVALHIISGRLNAEMLSKVRPENYKPLDMKGLIDESLILAKVFVDEVSRQEPPKHYIEKMRMGFKPEEG